MTGRKALAIESYCKRTNRSCVRFDYRGHGQSIGNYTEFTLGDWIDDALNVLDDLTSGPQVLVGSSMGGWIAFHLVLLRPSRVVGIVGIATAPDFIVDLIDRLPPEQAVEYERNGYVDIPSQYFDDPLRIDKHFVEESRRWNLLNRKPNESTIEIPVPVHLIHGKLDEDVPWNRTREVVNCIDAANTTVTLIEDGDHRLSREQDIETVVNALDRLTTTHIQTN